MFSLLFRVSVLPIITGEKTPVLRKKTVKVPKVTKAVLKLLRDMEDTMRDATGAGIAAPQIGESLRMCIAVIGGKAVALINPMITWKSKELVTEVEGCLSLPGQDVPVARAKEIIFTYTDEKGKPQERKLTDWDARVVQHEVDHLDGILIVDYIQTPFSDSRRAERAL